MVDTIEYLALIGEYKLMNDLQAMIDVAAESGWLGTTLRVVTLLQMCYQARWDTDSPLLTLPHLGLTELYCFTNTGLMSLAALIHRVSGEYDTLARMLRQEFDEPVIEEIWAVVSRLPLIR